MKLHFVCFLLALACVTVMTAPTPTPAPQQNGNMGVPFFGPFSAMYDLATSFAHFVPAVLRTGMQMANNVAKGMDHTLSGLAGGNGVTNLPAAVDGGQNYDQTDITNTQLPNSTTNFATENIPKATHAGGRAKTSHRRKKKKSRKKKKLS